MIFNHHTCRRIQYQGMMKTPLSIVYHQYGHIGFTQTYYHNGLVQSVVTIIINKDVFKDKNILSSQFYSAQNLFSIIESISKMIYSFAYICL